MGGRRPTGLAMRPGAIPLRLRESIAAAGISGLWVSRDAVAAMPDGAGAYALLLRLDEPVHLEAPRGTPCRLGPGWYAYAGSAQGSGGIRARLGHHFRRPKTPHWHIDRLTAKAATMAALAVTGGDECDIVAKLLGSGRFAAAAPRFGSTDCRRCASHLLAALAP